MKIWLGVMAAAAIAALLLRRDMYLDRIEWIAAVAGSCMLGLLCSEWTEAYGRAKSIMFSLAAAFMLYLGVSYVDLVVDHLLFHWPAAEEDGRALTLWEKAGELRHDVWETSFIAPVLVLLAIITGRLIRGGRAQSSM